MPVLTETLLSVHRYQHMAQLPILDETIYNLQRQGRISFYVSPELTVFLSVLSLKHRRGSVAQR